MYVALVMGNGKIRLYTGDKDVFGGWRWQPAPHIEIIWRRVARIERIEATDGPYGGPEYPTGGPQ